MKFVLEHIQAVNREKLPANRLGERQVRRDRTLMARVAHKRKSNKELGE